MFWADQPSDLSKHLKAGDRKVFTSQPYSGRSDLALQLPVLWVHGDWWDCGETPVEADSHPSSQGSQGLSAPAGSIVGLSGDRGGKASRAMPACVQSFYSGNLSSRRMSGTVLGARDTDPGQSVFGRSRH